MLEAISTLLAVGEPSPRVRWTAGSLSAVRSASAASIAACAARLGRDPAVQPADAAVRCGGSVGQEAGDGRGGIGADERPGVRRRLVPAARRVDRRSDRAPSARQPVPQGLAGRHVAEAEDQVGGERFRRPRGRSGRRRRPPRCGRGGRSGAARWARRGSGTRLAAASAAEGRRSVRSGSRPATISRARLRRSPPRAPRAAVRRGSRAAQPDRQRPPVRSRPSTASASVAVTSSGERLGPERVAPGQVEVDRAPPRRRPRRRRGRPVERMCRSPASSASWVPTSQNQRTASRRA